MLFPANVPTHIHIHQLTYNEKGNLGSLMAPARTSRIMLPQHWELVLKAARELDPDIIDVTEDQ